MSLGCKTLADCLAVLYRAEASACSQLRFDRPVKTHLSNSTPVCANHVHCSSCLLKSGICMSRSTLCNMGCWLAISLSRNVLDAYNLCGQFLRRRGPHGYEGAGVDFQFNVYGAKKGIDGK